MIDPTTIKNKIDINFMGGDFKENVNKNNF